MKPRSQTPKAEGPFAWVARDAAQSAGKLGITAFAVYHALAYFESLAEGEHKRRFPASMQQLADLLGGHRNTIKSALNELKKAGLVKVFSGRNKDCQNRRNAFFLASFGSTLNVQRCTLNVQPMRTLNVQPMRTLNVHNKEKEQLGPAPEGPDPNKEPRAGSACSPLTGGSVPKEPRATTQPKIEHGMPEVSQEQLDRHDRMVEFIERHGI